MGIFTNRIVRFRPHAHAKRRRTLTRVRWARVDEQGTRYLLGDSFGRLVLLALAEDANDDKSKSKLNMLYLGEVCVQWPPCCALLIGYDAYNVVDICSDIHHNLAIAVHFRWVALWRFAAHSDRADQAVGWIVCESCGAL